MPIVSDSSKQSSTIYTREKMEQSSEFLIESVTHVIPLRGAAVVLLEVNISTCEPPVCARALTETLYPCQPVVASGFSGGGEFGDEQTTQSAYMLSAPWAAGLASRAQRCLSDVRL